MRCAATVLGFFLAWASVQTQEPRPAHQSSRSHPFLFHSAADIARAREGVRTNPEFARLARELTNHVHQQTLADLPALDPTWWHALTNRPWSDCYPENYRHTLELPSRWAALARDCARASLLNNRLELAAKGRKALLGLADYPFEWQHFDTGMFYTIWTAAASEAYDILFADFTAAERARLDSFFHRFLDAVVTSDDYWVQHEPGGKLNNHYAWHKLGRAMIGLFYARPELVQQALYGPKGIDHLMSNGFKDNGLWLEGSIPYQHTTLVPLVLLAELLEHASYSEGLWHDKRVGGPPLKQTYDALVTLLWPDRTLPTVGDAYARRTHFGVCADLEIIARRFNDPTYPWFIHDRTTRVAQALFTGQPQPLAGAPPPQFTQVWTNMGYAALRSVEGTPYWSGAGWTAFATFSAQSVHEHADKLAVMLFGNGHLWLPDREAATAAAHAFSSDIQRRLNRETLCHNTLLVDSQKQRHPPQRLDLVEFNPGPDAKRLTIADRSGHLYPGVRQMRTLIVSPTAVLDFFQVQSDQPHDYAWMIHVDGQAQSSSLPHWTEARLPPHPPWSYLLNPRSAPAPGTYHESFTNAGQTLSVDLCADGPIEIVQCGFPQDDSPQPTPLPMRCLRCRRPTAWLLAIYRLEAPDPVPTLELRVRRTDARTWEIAAPLSSATTTHRVPAL